MADQTSNWPADDATYGWDPEDKEAIDQSRRARALYAQMKMTGKPLSPADDELVRREVAIYHIRKKTPDLPFDVNRMGSTAIHQRTQAFAPIKASMAAAREPIQALRTTMDTATGTTDVAGTAPNTFAQRMVGQGAQRARKTAISERNALPPWLVSAGAAVTPAEDNPFRRPNRVGNTAINRKLDSLVAFPKLKFIEFDPNQGVRRDLEKLEKYGL